MLHLCWLVVRTWIRSWVSRCGECDLVWAYLGAGDACLALGIDSVPRQVPREFVFQTIVDHVGSWCLLLLASWSLNDHGLHWTLGGWQSLVLLVIVSVSTHCSLLGLCWLATALQLEFGHCDVWSLFSWILLLVDGCPPFSKAWARPLLLDELTGIKYVAYDLRLPAHRYDIAAPAAYTDAEASGRIGMRNSKNRLSR